MYNDNLSDMITRIINCCLVKIKYLFIFFSKIKFNILKILKKEGYIENFFLIKNNNLNLLLIILKYSNNESVIKIFKIVSKQSLKIYKKYKEIPIFMNGLGFSILSTTNGIITDKDAKKLGIGGELICYVF